VILSTATDRPWSHYFCCVLGANTEFVRANPIATKRAVRAILKAADMCAAEPQRAATRLVMAVERPPFRADRWHSVRA
jgi:NitT/TauT family transport system substrate-binding protein